MRKIILFALCGLAWLVSQGNAISLGAGTVKEGCSVLIPVDLSVKAGISSVSVQISYDPQILTAWRIDAGNLATCFDDDFVTSIDSVNGQIRIAAFATKNLKSAINGCLATLVFSAGRNRAGTTTDLAISRATMGEETGVVDVSFSDPLEISHGIVKVLELLGNEVRITVDACTVPLFVSGAYVSDILKLTGDEATPDAIRSALEAPAANGMKTWQTYVLNLSSTDPRACVFLSSRQTKDHQSIMLTSSVVPLVDTGVKPTFLLQKSFDLGKTWQDVGTAQDAPMFTVDVKDDPTGLYRVKTVFTVGR